MSTATSRLAGWGRHPVVSAEVRRLADFESATDGATISRGLGRAYGDAALPAAAGDVVAISTRADRILSFDADTGVVRAQAGRSLGALHELLLNGGWGSPVMPGTQHVTLGGMVAADVHGKNHHIAGSIGAFVRSLRMRVADGSFLEVNAETEPELFDATIGGMGLTGHILEVELQLERVPHPWIVQHSEVVGDLQQLIEGLRAASRDWPMTVAWADGFRRSGDIGRGVVISGRWARHGEAPATPWRRGRQLPMPFSLPSATPRRRIVKTFNSLYWGLNRQRAGRRIVAPIPFFHPLDVAAHWNRFYGAAGFTQYQCVLPPADAEAAAQEVFELLADRRAEPFLIVIKDFGGEGRGTLSFPRPGITLSLDLPIGPETSALVASLNERVIAAGGRIYLAKDALTDAVTYRRMEPRLERFNAVRDKWDPERRLRSALSVRLLGDRA